MSLVIASDALALTEVSAWLVAWMVTLAGFGKSAGAVYKPALVIVPTVELPPATPLTLQLTAVFDVPVTVAVNCCVLPSNTLELEDDTVIVTDCGASGGGGVIEDEPPPQAVMAMEIASRQTCMTRGVEPSEKRAGAGDF